MKRKTIWKPLPKHLDQQSHFSTLCSLIWSTATFYFNCYDESVNWAVLYTCFMGGSSVNWGSKGAYQRYFSWAFSSNTITPKYMYFTLFFRQSYINLFPKRGCKLEGIKGKLRYSPMWNTCGARTSEGNFAGRKISANDNIRSKDCFNRNV